MRKALSLLSGVVFGLFVFVAPASAQHAAIGADKCAKMCHKIQFESWAKSKHATGEKKADCETCHGNGADYAKMSVMKDVAASKAAGMVIPDKTTCAKCHKPGERDGDLAKVHAHKS